MPFPSVADRDAGVSLVQKVIARNAFSAGVAQTIWTPATGSALYCTYLHLTAAGATVITVKIGATVVWEGDFTANWPMQDIMFTPETWLTTRVANAAMTITSSAAVTCGATVLGYEATV